MCRLVGYAAAWPTNLSDLVGEAQLAQFTALSGLHGDGWGTAWVNRSPGHVVTLETCRSTIAADHDPRFDEIASGASAWARIVHLRWATEGYAVDTSNTHPFSVDDLAFAHNGSIAPTAALEELLTPSTRAALTGDTDSERYFALIRQHAAEAPGDLAAATLAAVQALRPYYPHASLNALLLSREQLVVVHANSAHGVPVEEMLARPDGAPLDHVAAYFLMRWRRTADGALVFASSGLDARGWTPLPEESVTTVDLETLEMRHRRLRRLGASERVA